MVSFFVNKSPNHRKDFFYMLKDAGAKLSELKERILQNRGYL